MSKKNYHTADEIVNEIRLLEQMFRQTRSEYPYIDENHIGKTPILRFNAGDNIVYTNYEKPITKEFRDLNNKIAHFHNQNFIIRLYSVLNNYQVFQNLKISDSPELYTLKRIGNIYCHGSGSYDKTNDDHKRLMRRMIKTFNLEDISYSDFPISIDNVINQIIKASINYVNEQYP
jgi:hypothetical protein